MYIASAIARGVGFGKREQRTNKGTLEVLFAKQNACQVRHRPLSASPLRMRKTLDEESETVCMGAGRGVTNRMRPTN